MRKLIVLISLIAGLMLVSSPVTAQSTPQASPSVDFSGTDIEAIADSAKAADLDTLMTSLETPMTDADLPANFSAAEYVDPATATDKDLVIPVEDLDFSEGSVAYNVTYEPETDGFSIGLSSLNYIFVDGEITDKDMADFKDGASQGLEGDASGAEVAVEDVEINGVPAILISYQLEEEGIISIVQMVAIPVGNTMVLSMVVAASDDPTLDPEMVRVDAENLLLAGVSHLGVAVEGAQ
jgi:hypothetical protein